MGESIYICFRLQGTSDVYGFLGLLWLFSLSTTPMMENLLRHFRLFSNATVKVCETGGNRKEGAAPGVPYGRNMLCCSAMFWGKRDEAMRAGW